jgi:hypothetical protein
MKLLEYFTDVTIEAYDRNLAFFKRCGLLPACQFGYVPRGVKSPVTLLCAGNPAPTQIAEWQAFQGADDDVDHKH